jgi:hypothetical protein
VHGPKQPLVTCFHKFVFTNNKKQKKIQKLPLGQRQSKMSHGIPSVLVITDQKIIDACLKCIDIGSGSGKITDGTVEVWQCPTSIDQVHSADPKSSRDSRESKSKILLVSGPQYHEMCIVICNQLHPRRSKNFMDEECAPHWFWNGVNYIISKTTIDPSSSSSHMGDDIKKDQEKKEKEELKKSRPVYSECCICMDAEANSAFDPCGHMVACPTCASAQSACPLCRGAVSSRIRIFL